MMRKIPRNDAYKILRNLVDVPCESAHEEEVAQKLGNLTPGRLVDQMQSYADIENQTVEMERRCRAAGLKFFFDAGQLVQFRQQFSE